MSHHETAMSTAGPAMTTLAGTLQAPALLDAQGAKQRDCSNGACHFYTFFCALTGWLSGSGAEKTSSRDVDTSKAYEVIVSTGLKRWPWSFQEAISACSTDLSISWSHSAEMVHEPWLFGPCKMRWTTQLRELWSWKICPKCPKENGDSLNCADPAKIAPHRLLRMSELELGFVNGWGILKK